MRNGLKVKIRENKLTDDHFLRRICNLRMVVFLPHLLLPGESLLTLISIMVVNLFGGRIFNPEDGRIFVVFII